MGREFISIGGKTLCEKKKKKKTEKRKLMVTI